MGVASSEMLHLPAPCPAAIQGLPLCWHCCADYRQHIPDLKTDVVFISAFQTEYLEDVLALSPKFMN